MIFHIYVTPGFLWRFPKKTWLANQPSSELLDPPWLWKAPWISSGWWFFALPLGKMMDLVSWDDFTWPQYDGKNHPFMFQTTNQSSYLHVSRNMPQRGRHDESRPLPFRRSAELHGNLGQGIHCSGPDQGVLQNESWVRRSVAARFFQLQDASGTIEL